MCSTLELDFNPQNSWTPLYLNDGAIDQHYMSKQAIRYKVREHEVGDQKGKEWRRKCDTIHPTQTLLATPIDDT